MFMDILGESAALGGYFAIWKVVIFILLFGIWAWVGQWLDKDTLLVQTRQSFWNNLYVGTGSGAFLLWIILPTSFIVDVLLFLSIWVTLMIIYVMHRNVRVSRELRIFTAEHIRSILAREGKKEVKSRLVFVSSHGNKLPVPLRQEPEYAGHIAGERLVYEISNGRVSQVEMNPMGDNYQMLYVIDGVKGVAGEWTNLETEQAITYLKAVGGLEVKDRRKPQEGHFSVQLSEHRDCQWRIRTAGSTQGERMELERVEEAQTLKLESLGFNSNQLEAIKGIIAEPKGVVLVCGEQDSGISTTLYSMVLTHDAFIQNVASLEKKELLDMDNVSQRFTTDPTVEGKDYARQLQSVLRSDPDVVMVGFCEGSKMAQVGTKGAMDGKKLYFGLAAQSTFHGLQAWLNMVQKSEAVADTLLAVICQNLFRELCTECRVEYTPDKELLKKLNLPSNKIKEFYRPGEIEYDKRGRPIVCPVCQGTGYLGRTAIFETLFISDGLRELIRQDSPVNSIRAQCRKEEMLYLQEEALRRVIDGTTSIQEVLRVTTEKKNRPPAKKPDQANSGQAGK